MVDAEMAPEAPDEAVLEAAAETAIATEAAAS